MIRRLNFTDRTRIKHADVEITLREHDGMNWFDADLTELSNYHLPPESPVFIEAYRLSSWKRFRYGTIGRLEAQDDLVLQSFESPKGVRFRIKVTAATDNHRLIAEADAIPLIFPDEDEATRQSLLDTIPSDLGDEMFRVDFTSGPVLLINNKGENYKEIGRSAAFMSLAVPSVLREILMHIIVIDKHIDADGMDDWQSRWLRFVQKIPGVGDLPDLENSEDCLDWIQNCVAVFCKKQKTRTKFLEFWRDEE
jgi:hypothetical protein